MSYNHQNYDYDYREQNLPEQDWRGDLYPPVSPISGNASLNSFGHDQHGQIRPLNRSVSPIKEAEMPRDYGGQPYSPPVYPQHRHHAPYMPTASDLSPPDPEGRALRDIDNLFGARQIMSPSPEPEDHRSFQAPPPQYPSTPPRKHRQKARTPSAAPLMAHTRTPSTHNSPSPSRRHRGGPPAAAMGSHMGGYADPPEPSPYTQHEYPDTPPRQTARPNMHRHTDSASSNAPLMDHRRSQSGAGPPSPTRRSYAAPVAAAAAGAGMGAAGTGGAEYYGNQTPTRWRGEDLNTFNPSDIADDGDDGLDERPRSKKGRRGLAAAAGLGAQQLLEKTKADSKSSMSDEATKKAAALTISQGWIVGSIILLVVLAAVVGGTTGGILGMKNNSDSNGSTTSPSSSSGSSSSKDGFYGIDSPEIKALLDNKDFHKVFPGMDYTPLNAQYPECIHNPPDQNNITMDIAQLAQLTPAVRLYGTDCNQTEMVLEAISRLGYNDTLQVWLGVWLGSNATTNDRQLAQMETLLKSYPSKHYAGVIVGNEVLFREDMTEAALASNLSAVRQTLSDLSIDIPVATSDLGDDWTDELAADSDIVLANVHPFFAGVTPSSAPGWTWDFWQNNNVGLKTAPSSDGKGWPGSIIAEVGWPSDGGENCGGKDGSCLSGQEGAVAGVEELNTFMDGWVCQSLTNGTTYFWFEAFNEPWKKSFDTDTQKWESQWGLMDENRNVKKGLKIPDCEDGTTTKEAEMLHLLPKHHASYLLPYSSLLLARNDAAELMCCRGTFLEAMVPADHEAQGRRPNNTYETSNANAQTNEEEYHFFTRLRPTYYYHLATS
ncbi:hypothetical protein Q7P37_002075 [Cladosporium fusiforme]